jgi:hypothetical protein
MKLHFSALLIIILFSFCFNSLSWGQKEKPFSFASAIERKNTERELKNEIDSLVSLSFQPEKAERLWKKAFWAMELMLYSPPNWEERIPYFIDQLSSFDAEFQRAFLEMLFTLYPSKFNNQIISVWPSLANAKNQAMALEYLAIAHIFPDITENQAIFPTDWYRAYQKRWSSRNITYPTIDSFSNDYFLPGDEILCSFQYTNRGKPGFLMIRKKNGSWVTDENGKPLKFKQLARSISNLPYYLTNGNTPQGLYRVTGFGYSSNEWIGPSKNIQMILPYENDSSYFSGIQLTPIDYETLLNPLIKNFPSLWEAYFAGKMGRTEIIAHGTTIDPSWYNNEAYFPCTPSLGCLCSPEIWNKKGRIVKSAQQAWIDALERNNINPKWLIVVEIEDTGASGK